MKAGETYRCTDDRCGCEIQVSKGSAQTSAKMAPRCCCGKDMKAVESKSGSALAGEMRST